MSDQEQAANRGRFKKGQSGNPAGRPRGRRDERVLFAQALFDGEAEAIITKCIEMAKEGDRVCIKLCIERILPPVRSRPVRLDIPEATAKIDEEAGRDDEILPLRDTDEDEAEDGEAAAEETTTAEAIDGAMAAVVRAMAEGELSPAEALTAAQVVDMRRRTLETVEFERRLTHLEEVDHAIAECKPGPIVPPTVTGPNAHYWARP
jgi:hypothetical protein